MFCFTCFSGYYLARKPFIVSIVWLYWECCSFHYSFLVEVTTRHQVEVQQAVLSIEQLLLMAELEATPANVGAVQETPTISWVQIVLLVYLAGILFLVCRNIYSLI